MSFYLSLLQNGHPALCLDVSAWQNIDATRRNSPVADIENKDGHKQRQK